jgi:hypothetical protein
LWGQAVVVSGEDVVEVDGHVCFECFVGFAAGFVDFFEHSHCHAQPGLSRGSGHQIRHRRERVEQHALAGSRHVAEQAAFDRVAPLTSEYGRAVGRVMSHSDAQPHFVDQLLQVLFENVSPAAVAPATVAQQQKFIHRRVQVPRAGSASLFSFFR